MNLYQQILENHLPFLETIEFCSEKEMRVDALKEFQKIGFPNRKNEEYKYTNLTEILDKNYSFFPKNDYNINESVLNKLLIDREKVYYLIFVNGEFQEKISLIPENLVFYKNNCDARISEVLSDYYNKFSSPNSAFKSLNLAYNKYELSLYIPKNTLIDKPINIIYISINQEKNTFYNPKNLLVVDENSEVDVIENHYNLDDVHTLTNSVTEIFVNKNSKINWNKLQNDNKTSYLVDNTYVSQEIDSKATVNTFSFGGKLTRNNLDFVHNGENINSFMNGITVTDDSQLVDHHTAVHHNFPYCESYQNYKGIFGDKSHGVFNGKVFVNKIAQKTNAYQQNNNILLSKGAKIDTKPQLEIFADDVKCSHGCTVGQLNSEALFYLRSRGISENDAKTLLIGAFTYDVMQNINIEFLKQKVSNILLKKIESISNES